MGLGGCCSMAPLVGSDLVGLAGSGRKVSGVEEANYGSGYAAMDNDPGDLVETGEESLVGAAELRQPVDAANAAAEAIRGGGDARRVKC